MARRTAVLELDSRSRDGVVIVAAHGVLDISTASRLRDYLAKVGADQPKAVVVDLADLRIHTPAATAVFVTAHAALAEWPGVPMVLASPEGLLARQHVSRFIPVRSTVTDAVAAAGDPVPRLVDRLLLPNDPTSPDLARGFARDSCALWGHPDVADHAAALLGELVTNTVTHTRSVSRIRIELRRELLSLAAYDDDATVPGPSADADGTRGLALVARTAAAWGCSPTLRGGKVVWATLRLGQPAHRSARVSAAE
jgi:anti-anti-sigma regulatory factor